MIRKPKLEESYLFYRIREEIRSSMDYGGHVDTEEATRNIIEFIKEYGLLEAINKIAELKNDLQYYIEKEAGESI